jgi:hypothetical protein
MNIRHFLLAIAAFAAFSGVSNADCASKPVRCNDGYVTHVDQKWSISNGCSPCTHGCGYGVDNAAEFCKNRGGVNYKDLDSALKGLLDRAERAL